MHCTKLIFVKIFMITDIYKMAELKWLHWVEYIMIYLQKLYF